MKKTARKKPEVVGDETPEFVEEQQQEEKEEVKEERSEDIAKVPEEENIPAKTAEFSSFYEKVMGEKPRPTRIEEASGKRKSINTKLFFLGGFVFVLTVLISSMAGLFLLNRGLPEKKTETQEVKETAITPSPTPISFRREEWFFEVLNGSNTSGIAAKGAEKIKTLGYKVSKVGNADDSVDSTQVFVSKDATDAQKNLILEDLKKDFGELTVADSLTDSEKTVRIILAE